MTNELHYTGKNNVGALLSFLRVLAVALATAVLPHVLLGQNGDPIVGKEILLAVAAAALLTVINYFRPGETRFGTTKPNVVREDGYVSVGLIVVIVLAVLGVFYLLAML